MITHAMISLMEGYNPGKKSFSAAEIGAPVDREKITSPELFKASLSFDFVFGVKNGEKHPYCVEFNGDDSGIAGMQYIPNAETPKMQKLMAGIRDHRNPGRLNKVNIANDVLRDIKEETFPVSEKAFWFITKYLRNSIEKEPMFTHAYKNDQYIKGLADDKVQQEEIIPQRLRPRRLHLGEEKISSTGKWIIKPRDGRGGKDILIIDNEGIEEVFDRFEDKMVFDTFVIEELIPSLPADAVKETAPDRAASLRLLIDFRYLENNEIDIVYETAYQRVSPYDTTPQDSDADHRSLEDHLVVNYARGAEPHAVSREEFLLAHAAALEIIHSLAESYRQNGAIES